MTPVESTLCSSGRYKGWHDVLHHETWLRLPVFVKTRQHETGVKLPADLVCERMPEHQCLTTLAFGRQV